MVSAKILIVEDESIIALDIERSLISSGYTVVAIASSSTEALDAVAQHQPDLILMDIRIRGDKDGIETAALIQAQFQLPVVYLTAHADEDTLQRVKLTQPFGYVLKPFQDPDLAAAIEVALSRHQAEITVQKALAREKELNNLKSHFVSVVSHEFRNPLSSILVSLNLLEQYDQQLTVQQKQNYFYRAKDSVMKMHQLLNDVLTLGEVEISGLQFNPAPMDLSKFCQEVIEEYQFNDGAKHVLSFATINGSLEDSVTFSSHPANDLAYLDEKLLRHILTNLLSNAIKYSPTGSEVQITLKYTSNVITLCIQDQGIGIPQSDQASLFDSFKRGSNVNTIAGTGLGLAIVKQCVEAHGGTIMLESEVGQGTTFLIHLPRVQE